MPTLTLALLGTFHVQHGSTTLTEFHSNSVRALLVYLAVEPDRPHERKLLGDLLWPDEPPAKGLLNLQQAFYRLDQALAPAALPVPFTQITRQTVQRNSALPLTLDTHRLSSLISATQTHRHRRLTVCGPCLVALREAVALYQGDFLAGFSASAPFDEWLLAWRERLRTQVIWALDVLATHHTERGEWAAAETYLRRWLELEPWREEAHRHLMLALASAGQRSAALAQYEQCRRMLARDLDTAPEVNTTALAARLRVSNPMAWFAPPYAVPAVETPLMGRATALAAIAAQLAAPTGRLLTLTGPGGSGKTRLALAAAAVERGAFADGVFFVSLVPITDEAGLLAAIAERLGIPLTGSHNVTVTSLVTFLKPRELLLVLDNFEPLLAHAPLLSALRDAAPNLRLLVTSRVPLSLLDEVVLRVGGLEPAAVTSAAEPGDDPATQLFVQAARRVAPAFTPTEAELVTIRMISQDLDRMPLALMLAAGLVDHRDPAAILTLVRADPDALESNLRDLPERHRSIRNLFASSWQLIPAEQQQILAHCVLFAASFSRAAVSAVAMKGAPGNAMVDRLVRRSLTALSDHALLQRVGPDRYALHPLVRQFAAEYHACLPAAEQAASRARHRAYFLGLVAHHADAIVGPTGKAVVELLRIELADIHLAWHNASRTNDLALMGAATHGLLDLLRIGELHAAGTFTFAAAITRLRSAITDDHDASPLARHTLVQLLVAHAEMRFIQGDYATVIAEAQAAVELAHALGNPALEGEAQFAWGKGLRRQGAMQAAQAQFAHGARVIRPCHDSPALRRLRSD
ncbi:MAG: BTAD domain-containing putative transcriptional regulator, partial [Chloroflexales bacterium]